MRFRAVRSAALVFFLILGIAPVAAAGMSGYTITAISPDDITGIPHDPVPIASKDLTLREMLIAASLTVCPLLMYPAELFFFLKLMAALGYRRAERDAIFRNRNRQRIFDCISANPGIKFHALERLTEMKEGTLKYHLLILSAKKRIVSYGNGGSLRYFENNGRFSDLEKKIFLHLQNPTTRRILEILASCPDVSRKDIAGVVGIAGPSITWHTKRLSGDGIITACKNGRAVRYTLCPEGANIFRRFREQGAGRGPGKVATGEKAGE